jgi:hypothetical protein
MGFLISPNDSVSVEKKVFGVKGIFPKEEFFVVAGFDFESNKLVFFYIAERILNLK